ncbi:unnamed protein product [Fusarium graminearum]|nr:unnamed protein product [Fusarium graminearum]
MFGAVSIILSTSKSINAPWTNAKHVAADDKVIRVKDPVFVVAMIFNIKKTRLQNGTDVKLGNEGQAKVGPRTFCRSMLSLFSKVLLRMRQLPNENRQGPGMPKKQHTRWVVGIKDQCLINLRNAAPSYSGGGGGGGGGSSSSSTRRGIQLSPIEQCRTVRG